jgi:ubiquinone/menaquinone biosynthesis C-methylase UbiE
MTARQSWSKASHEAAVERFYSQGVNSDTEVHRGFLNFGLWEEGIDDYVAAAQNLVRRLASMLGLGPGSRLLDVACGMGSQGVYLHRTVPGLEIDAIDVTWRHVERALRRAGEEGIASGLRFHHGSATALPFPERSFTHLMSIEGAEHFRTRRRFLAEARRVLQPGGVMALADYTITRAPRSAAEWLVVDVARRLWRIPRENLWTAVQYRDELRAAGFVEASVESVGPLTFPGYYREQCRPDFRAEMRRLQGQATERLGHLIDVVTNRAYQRGLVDYVLVRGVEPAGGSA